MKVRSGFVSNSSSSSFIIDNMTKDEVNDKLFNLYKNLYSKNKSHKQLKYDYNEMLKIYNKIEFDKNLHIIENITYWKFKKDYLKHGQIAVVSNGDNAIPYEMLEEMINNGWKYNHLG